MSNAVNSLLKKEFSFSKLLKLLFIIGILLFLFHLAKTYLTAYHIVKNADIISYSEAQNLKPTLNDRFRSACRGIEGCTNHSPLFPNVKLEVANISQGKISLSQQGTYGSISRYYYDPYWKIYWIKPTLAMSYYGPYKME